MNLEKNISLQLETARNGFMNHSGIWSGERLRMPFGYRLLPFPEISGCQWDHGDNTNRALRAWYCVEKMSGLTDEDRKTVDGLKKHLEFITNPETGMVFIPEYKDHPLLKGRTYYHTWDQGRWFDYMVLCLEQGDVSYLPKIRKFLKSMVALSETKEEPGGTARWWPSEVYFDKDPQFTENICNPVDFRDFTIGCSQMLLPLARLYKQTNDPADLKLALECARGFLTGYEHRRSSTSPMFAENGKFYGHFHCVVSGLDGIVLLANILWKQGERDLSAKWIDLAQTVWKWIFDGKDNMNRAAHSGWFPESATDFPHNSNELCCTADMLELTAHMAECAELDPRWNALSDLWDELEKYVRNDVFSIQFRDLEKIKKHLPEMPEDVRKKSEESLKKQLGVWIGGRTYINEVQRMERKSDFEKREYIQKNQIRFPADQEFLPVLSGPGCCAFSGIRALFSVWDNAIADKNGLIDVRIPISRKTDSAVFEELPECAGLSVKALKNLRVRVRIPVYAEHLQISGKGECSPDGKFVSAELPAGSELILWWTPRESVENGICGPDNSDGTYLSSNPQEGRCHFTLRWRGPEVIETLPKGRVFPIDEEF